MVKLGKTVQRFYPPTLNLIAWEPKSLWACVAEIEYSELVYYGIFAVYDVLCRPEQRFFFIYDCCLLQDQDDDITKSVLYFDPKSVSSAFNIGFV